MVVDFLQNNMFEEKECGLYHLYTSTEKRKKGGKKKKERHFVNTASHWNSNIKAVSPNEFIYISWYTMSHNP